MIEGLVEAKQNSSYGYPEIYGIVHKGTRSSSGYLRICLDHSGVVSGGSETYKNGTREVLDQPEWFPDNRWASLQLSRSSGSLNCNSYGIGNCPDGSETS